MIVGERVQSKMKEAGLSQAELARRLNLAQPSIFKLIHRNKVGSKHLHRIARELGTTPAFLAGETDDPQADAPPPPELNSHERELLGCYRALGGAQQTALLTIAMAMAGKGPAGSVNAPPSPG